MHIGSFLSESDDEANGLQGDEFDMSSSDEGGSDKEAPDAPSEADSDSDDEVDIVKKSKLLDKARYI